MKNDYMISVPRSELQQAALGLEAAKKLADTYGESELKYGFESTTTALRDRLARTDGHIAVTREMINAAHGVTMATTGGGIILSAALLERIYFAMEDAK